MYQGVPTTHWSAPQLEYTVPVWELHTKEKRLQLEEVHAGQHAGTLAILTTGQAQLPL